MKTRRSDVASVSAARRDARGIRAQVKALSSKTKGKAHPTPPRRTPEPNLAEWKLMMKLTGFLDRQAEEHADGVLEWLATRIDQVDALGAIQTLRAHLRERRRG